MILLFAKRTKRGLEYRAPVCSKVNRKYVEEVWKRLGWVLIEAMNNGKVNNRIMVKQSI